MELTTVLRHQIATLRPKWRDLFVLCDVQEVNVAQAARQLGISLADARSSLYRTRFRLRELLSSSFDGAQKLPMGDVDRDGITDFLITSGWSGVHGFHSGRVFIISSGVKTN